MPIVLICGTTMKVNKLKKTAMKISIRYRHSQPTHSVPVISGPRNEAKGLCHGMHLSEILAIAEFLLLFLKTTFPIYLYYVQLSNYCFFVLV